MMHFCKNYEKNGIEFYNYVIKMFPTDTSINESIDFSLLVLAIEKSILLDILA